MLQHLVGVISFTILFASESDILYFSFQINFTILSNSKTLMVGIFHWNGIAFVNKHIKDKHIYVQWTMFASPQNLYVYVLVPNVMVFGSGVLER